MKIICGTDFTIHAQEAANVAAALVMPGRSELTLVHAVEPAQMEFLSKPYVDLLREKLRRKLVEEGNRLRESGADVRENLVLGKPDAILAASARRSQADLIVVSSLGQVAPIQWLIGSVAERTARNAAVPTLVVRDPESLLAWARGKRALNIFVGYDFSESSDAALCWVASLKGVGPCNITVTYLSWPPSETWRLGIGGHASQGGNAPEVHDVLERDLKERCAKLLGKTEARLRVVSGWGRPDAHLIDLAKASEADLIVVGTNQRRGLNRFWLGSVSRGILHHAATNVVCVPMPEEADAPRQDISGFRRVLVPTDFSKLGNKAIAFAYGAARRGGEVSLVHVIPPVGGFKADAKGTDGRHLKQNRALTARLERLVPEDAHAQGIQSRVEVVKHQHPAAAICQAAERAGVDLICIGSRGRSGLRKRLLGSVTESVMRRSSHPVLVIRS